MREPLFGSNSALRRSRLLAAGAAALLLLLSFAAWRRRGNGGSAGGGAGGSSVSAPWSAAAEKDTLVLYVYRPGDDPESVNNFNYFVLAAMTDEYRCSYVVLVHAHDKEKHPLPQLPPWGRYLIHREPCYDWGVVGWALGPGGGGVDYTHYSFFVIVTSSVRGPFVPSHLQPYMHWTDPLISRLSDRVKLVGATISCHQPLQEPRPANASGGGAAKWRRNPRVSSGAVATDRAGIQILIDDLRVLACHTTPAANGYYSELGAAAAVLRVGFTIDSLLARFQGVDWRDDRSWCCNGGLDPAGVDEYAYDGTWLEPLEVMFVRVRSNLLLHRLPSAAKAAKLSAWEAAVLAELAGGAGGAGGAAGGTSANASARISSNEFKDQAARYKLPRVLTGLVRGMKCFDLDYFVGKNADVRSQSQYPHVVWRFFVYVGQFEDRAYRYTCPMDYKQFVTPAF